MARDGRIEELKRIRQKVESLAGRTISEHQLIEALDHPDLLDAIAQRVKDLDLRHEVLRGSCTNIDGWTLRAGTDGYWRLYKTIDGKTRSIYLGKRPDWEKARRKIRRKEKSLGLSYW
jgi:hypothetical protein